MVIPTHGQRHEVTHRAIRSVLQQQGVSFEIIIVDDASIPPFRLPPDLVDDPGIRIVRRDVNGGAAAARNQGAAEAQGVWLAFLDSDDVWSDHKLADQLAWAEKSEDARLLVVSAGFRLIADVRAGGGGRGTRALIPAPADDVLDFASGCWFCPGSTVLMRLETFQRIGPFDTSLKRLEDLDWYLRFAMSGGELTVVPSVLVDVYVGGRPSAAFVREAAERLMIKYNEAWPEKKRVRHALISYLALEQAAAYWYERRLLLMSWHLMRSWVHTPRLRLHLKPFWSTATELSAGAQKETPVNMV